MTAKRDLKRRVRQRQARTGEAYVTARRHVVAASPAATDVDGDVDGDVDADAETGSEAADPSGTTAGGPAAEPADAATASPAAGALRVATDPAPATEAAAPGAAGTIPAGAVAAAPGAVDAEIDTIDPTGATAPAPSALAGTVPAGAAAVEIDSDDTGPVRAAAPAAVARGDDTIPRTTAAPAPGKPAGAMSVVELLDVSEQARRLGLVCRVAMFPGLAARVEPASVLTRLRDLLVETAGDPQFQLLAQVALTGHASPLSSRALLQSFETVHRFFRRARAGIGGVSEDGTTLAFHVAGRDGLVPIGCAVHWSSRGSRRSASLVLSGIDDLVSEVAGFRDWLTAEGRAGAAPRQVTDLLTMRLTPVPVHLAPKPFAPTLFVIHDGRRYPITQDEFLIGRSRATVHLTIRDGMVSRHHAAVIRRQGVHYIKDLGSIHGITYKGMRIDNKRIDEGDVFQIGDYELRFTYRGEDEE